MMEKTEKAYQVPTRTNLKVKSGDKVHAGDQLTDGPKNPHDIFRVSGMKACEQYLVREVQNVYKSQGVDINDKHIEVIARQMLKKGYHNRAGDSGFPAWQLVDRLQFDKVNKDLSSQMKATATASQNLMGITKASSGHGQLSGSSFIPGDHQGADRCCPGKQG
ncbi:MAG: hypothetical protein U5N58_12900 [Actinomycetota bacterium]|nr:hypothetical protein [Actinomycetota bacterium]